jgi:hypothetical protein
LAKRLGDSIINVHTNYDDSCIGSALEPTGNEQSHLLCSVNVNPLYDSSVAPHDLLAAWHKSLISCSPSLFSPCKAEQPQRPSPTAVVPQRQIARQAKASLQLCKPLRQGAKVQYCVVYLFILLSLFVCFNDEKRRLILWLISFSFFTFHLGI